MKTGILLRSLGLYQTIGFQLTGKLWNLDFTSQVKAMRHHDLTLCMVNCVLPTGVEAAQRHFGNEIILKH